MRGATAAAPPDVRTPLTEKPRASPRTTPQPTRTRSGRTAPCTCAASLRRAFAPHAISARHTSKTSRRQGPHQTQANIHRLGSIFAFYARFLSKEASEWMV
ncbi:protein of unknown function [Burkholderia multivorans]